MMFEKLAYVPLDVPRVDFELSEMLELFEHHGQPHHPYPHIWDAFTVYGDVVNFASPVACDTGWMNRYHPEITPRMNPVLTGDLGERLTRALMQLPYQQLTFAQILSQKITVAAHQDGLYQPDEDVRKAVYGGAVGFHGEPEPAGLKVMLTHRDARCFYLSERAGSPRQFIRLPEGTSSFAINERTFFHGAKYLGEPKFLLSTFGVIDMTRHEELIRRSMEVYYDYAIEF